MKKKVLFINNHFQYSDGTVRALIGLCNDLDPEKYDITVMPVYRCDMGLKKELSPDIKLKKAFGFYFFGFDKLVRLVPPSLIYKLFVKEKYDIEVGFQWGVPTKIIGNSTNKKAAHIIWMHTYGVDRKCFLKADRIICVSKCNAARCREEVKGIDVDYCYNLIDEQIIRKASEEETDIITNGGPVFVTVGRLSPEKGYVRLVRILSELRSEGYKFGLILVGGGPEQKRIENEISRLNMKDCVFMTGAQKNPHKYTARSDVFICSSLSEGYSTACTEAAILGIPIITTAVSGSEEIIEACECGTVTGIDDEALKAGIRAVLSKPELISEWKEKMKQTSEKFTLQYRRKRAAELFEEFCELSDKRNNAE